MVDRNPSLIIKPAGSSDAFTIQNTPARLKRLKKDPWAEIAAVKQSITKAVLKQVMKSV